MKNFWQKILFIIAFILCFIPGVFAVGEMNITSVTFDNSSSFLSINSFDNEEFTFSAQPKLYIVEDEKKAYFDINSAVLKCPPQDLVIDSPNIKQIMVKQFSLNPNVVRVVIFYNQGFTPNNIQLRKVNNTLFVRFKFPQLSNFYFQQIYADAVSAVSSFYENIGIQIPVIASNNDLLTQINSAFNLGTTEDVNFILSKKDLVLPTRYYLDNVSVRNNVIHVNGNGSLTLTKPLYLSNPTRAVYDLPNTFVNPTIRNKETFLTEYETVKIGQFDRTTARIVITSNSAEKFVPVVYGDAQHLAFVNRTNINTQTLFSSKSVLTAVNDEVNDIQTHSVKLVFSRPIVYGLERTASGFELFLFNAEKSQDLNLKAAFIFDQAKISNLKGGGIKLTVPAKKDDVIDVHVGVDGKTLRIRHKSVIVKLPEKEKTPEVVIPISPVRVRNHKFVVIDPGHGGADVGATRNGIYEKDIVLDVSNRVAELLRKKGYEVYMTRDNDATMSLQERVEYSENVDPDMFISIHVNSSNSDAPNGIETHYYKDNSLDVAKSVHASLLNNVKANNRGLFKSKFYVINHTTAPAILVEIGFLSNPTEREEIVSDTRKQDTAKAIAEGIDEYLK